MSDQMAAMIAKRFIQRRDVKAIQRPNGDYFPDRSPFMMNDLKRHLAGDITYGHYLLDHDDKCKLFAFDIDLNKGGTWTQFPDLSDQQYVGVPDEQLPTEVIHQVPDIPGNGLREAWLNRAHPGRNWWKYELRACAEVLSTTIATELELPVAVAYTGSKGLHVYGFTGSVSAREAREAAEVVMALTGKFELFRGKNFFRSIDQNPVTGFPNLSVEIYPKQESLKGHDLGNLLRLPLGRNLKSTDPTFFIDQRLSYNTIAPHPDPIALLETGRPWL